MTISSTTRVAGPFIGNGTATVFPFTFKVFAAADLDVIRLNSSTGVETTLVLNSDYTVTLNGNQNTNPGGSVTLSAGALATGLTLTITSDIANLQPTDLTNQGGFYPEVITDSLDRATIQIQQMADDLTRSIKTPISDGLSLNMELPAASQRANSFLAFDASGEPTVVTAGSSGAPATITRQTFSGTGSQTAFTLASDPGALGNSAQVYIGGVYQQRSTYTISGTTLTFSQAPVAGTDNIEFVNFLTSNIGATSADLVTYTPAGSGAVARSAASKFGDTVSVKDFGAIGDGVANDTVAIQAALNSGATCIYLPRGTYKISQVIVPNGVRRLDWSNGVIKGLGTGTDTQPLLVLGSMSGVGAITTPISISANIDMSAGDRCAIGGHSVSNCTINNTSIYGFVDTASVVNGLYFLAGCNNNIITNNSIVGVPDPAGTVNLVHFTANPPTYDGGYLTGSGVVTQPPAPATGNIVTNNVLKNGRYAVVLQGSYRCVVANNYCHYQDARSIYLGNAAWENTISDNLCSEYVSSAIHLAYGASFNVVSNNRCVRNAAYANGESAIQAYLGTTDNHIVGNHIRAGTNYGIYIGPDAHRNVIDGNRVSGFQRAAIMVENDWISPLPALNSISKPNYVAPFLGAPSWSFQTLDTCIIKNNTIGAGLVGTAVGIAFAQIDSLGSTGLSNVKIDGNHFIDLGVAHALWGYYMTQAKLTGLVITGNRNNPGETFYLANPSTFPQWGPIVEYYGENNTFDQIVNGELIMFAAGDTTPSIKTNSGLPNRRVYQCNNTSPTTITDFDDAVPMQTITIRLDVNTTIAHNSSLIRCKGGVNVTGATSNDFITFIDLGGGIWFETWRSF